MTSRQGDRAAGGARDAVPTFGAAGGTRTPVPSAALRVAARLAWAVLAAALLVAAAEAALAAWAPPSAAGGPDPLAETARLAAGAVLVAPLAMALGGWRLARRHAEAVRDLEVDDLTGTGSRRAFAADLPDAVRRAGDEGRPLTLALVELTDVPAAVELLGRRRTEALVGAAAVSLTARGGGPPAATYRLAGELFAVLLPGLGPDAAFGVVDDLLARVARAAAPLGAGAGLCSLDDRCPDAQLLLVGASAALDEARALGPGRVVASADEGSGLRWLATPGTGAGD
jgi:GGDEF domain-containing protein